MVTRKPGTKKPKPVVIDPTASEIKLANQLIEQAKFYTGDFTFRFSQAARDFHYESYGALPAGVKTQISRIANQVKKKLGGRKKRKVMPPLTSNLYDYLKEHLPSRMAELARTDRHLLAD